MAAPTLTGANIIFHTNDDDKNFETELTVTVHLRDGKTVAATISGALAHFDNNSDHGPYHLMVVTPVTREQLQTGTVTISIMPSGNDTWRFNFLLDMLFSDGSHLISRANGIELTQDQNQQAQTFGIE